jgi:glycine C-acetyltransferase
MAALEVYGVGAAAARFICGTTTIHQWLESSLARFLQVEAAMTFSSAWAANTGLYPALAETGDVIFSDALNHASIIDGLKLTRPGVVREVYPHGDTARLRELLQRHRESDGKIIVTDGVFSMEGDLAPLPDLVALADEFDALLVVDDSHGLGVIGRTGRGTPEHFGVLDRIGVHVGTLGKTLGGGAGGFVAGPRAVVDAVTQRARPHVFSNAISPVIAAASAKSLEIIEREPSRMDALAKKTDGFRAALLAGGLHVGSSKTPIVPVLVGDGAQAARISAGLLNAGIFAVAFGYPVVPEGEARIRFQVSQAHSSDDLARAARAIVHAFHREKELIKTVPSEERHENT